MPRTDAKDGPITKPAAHDVPRGHALPGRLGAEQLLVLIVIPYWVARVDQIVAAMRSNPVGVRYADLMKVCVHYFGEPRQQGSSHAVFKTPWPGDPRVNIQADKGKAKAYQVRQVLRAITKLEERR